MHEHQARRRRDLPLLNDIDGVLHERAFSSGRSEGHATRERLPDLDRPEEAGTGVAYATMFHKDRRARAQLASIAVLPEHRKKGIATTLLHRIEDAATRRERS